MNNQNKTRITSFLLLLFVVISCNKEKRYSTKLQKGETWQVIEVSVDGTNTQLFGQWKVTSDTDISEQVPELTWTTPNIGNAQFQWQFQDKGKAFQLNYKLLCEECEGSLLDSLDYIANDLTGK